MSDCGQLHPVVQQFACMRPANHRGQHLYREYRINSGASLVVVKSSVGGVASELRPPQGANGSSPATDAPPAGEESGE